MTITFILFFITLAVFCAISTVVVKIKEYKTQKQKRQLKNCLRIGFRKELRKDAI